MKKIYLLFIGFVIALATVFVAWNYRMPVPSPSGYGEKDELSDRNNSIAESESDEAFDNPAQFDEYYRQIMTRDGETSPGYLPGYRIREFQKAAHNIKRASARTESYTWTERGPANVPGRTRGILILPGDLNKNTWLAGSVGGGIWKTTNGGQSWTNKTPDIPNLSTTSLAYSASNPDIIYAGTGESYGAGGLIEITGQGLYKSLDGGETWNLINSTIDKFKFHAISRIIVDPANPDILLISVNQNIERGLGFSSGIFKSVDGGQNWYQVYDPHGWIQQVIYEPGNFNIQYAGELGTGVAKSTDAGETWNMVSNGIFPSGRVELAISPQDHSRLFAAVEGEMSGVNSDVYISEDGGINWQLVVEVNNAANRDFFAATTGSSPQGGWNNTLAVHPFNNDVLYVGGVDLWKMEIQPGEVTGKRTFGGVKDTGVDKFMQFVNFSAGTFWGGRLAVGTIDTSRFVSIEIRFGPGIGQKAHRFETPSNGGVNGDGGAGIPDSLYEYMDYVNVPFEAWDIKNNRQLMVSFRDQAKNGIFDLIHQKTDGLFDQQSREYFYIHDVDYDPNTPSAFITKNGGQSKEMMYFLWPYLPEGETWTPASLPDSKLVINWTTLVKRLRKTTRMTTWQGNETEGGRKLGYVHADQHNIIPVVMNAGLGQFKFLNTNDGGVFHSVTGTDPGLGENDWIFAGNNFNTAQFYGIDKKHGANEFVGGLQDNGSFLSPVDTTADAGTKYHKAGGGDGFEAAWNYANSQEIIISIYNNSFSKTKDGGKTWISATRGLTDIGANAPFISRLANSKSKPEVLFAVGSKGVWKSNDFGDNWAVTQITTGWKLLLAMNVKVSISNSDIIWAGGEMSDKGNLFVSTDGGGAFHAVNNFTDVTLGSLSGIATHPYEDSTAYALFSFAGAPKILRTKDLGNTWEDISGFGTNSTSSNGFPDVVVHCLLVLPNDPARIWAGTEIGIFESIDNGQNWGILNEPFPSVSVWDMKVVDDKVVIGTHGRGIWTATIPDLPEIIMNPVVESIGVSTTGDLVVKANLRSGYDSTVVMVNGGKTFMISGTSASDSVINMTYGGQEGEVIVSLISYKSGKHYISFPGSGIYFTPNSISAKYVADFSETFVNNDFIGTGFQIRSIVGFNPAIHSPHGYALDTTYYFYLKTPITVSADTGIMSYDDIAIVEPGDPGTIFGDAKFWDYVVVEGSEDGVNWKPLAPGYDARTDGTWLDAYNSKKSGTSKMYKRENINILNTFNAGDIIFVRFRLFSDANITSWGWAIDNLYVQEARLLAIENPDLNISKVKVYPNPFTQSVHIEYFIPKEGPTTVEIIDTQGRKITNLPMGFLSPGKHEVDWDASGVPDGVYITRVICNGKISLCKIIKD